MQFTDTELNVIRCALQAAAEIYENDAKLAEATEIPSDAHPRIAAQFKRQARDARALVERIDESN